jgi:thiol-disulfide isomerase/thioredoxin
MYNKKFMVIALLLIVVSFSVGVYALDVNYFYSPSCSACQTINPFIQSLNQKYSFHNWNVVDVTKQQTGIRSVPTLVIGEKVLVGIEEIATKAEAHLNCNPNIQPQTTCSNSNKQTLATPNHQRPCSAPILFGGFE